VSEQPIFAVLADVDGTMVTKDKILTLINNEDKKDPLSDQRIAEILHEQGLRIARRTVAKYREALRLLPARARRRYA